MSNTLLLIDGHSMAFRAFYALRAENFQTSTGIYTNAVYGFASTLHKLMSEYEPSHIAVAFDLPGGTFRTRQYPDYKAGRSATPEEFKGQIELIQSLLDALGVSWFTYDDYEADDIVASLATQAQAEGMRVYVASGDKDSFQLVTDTCSVLYPMPRSEMLVLDREGVHTKTGVYPEQYLDLAALVGEKADNLPGVPGVGPKTAVKWLDAYTNIQGIIDNAESISGKVGQALRDNLEQIQLNRQLNDMVKDLHIVSSFDELQLAGADRERVNSLCDTLEISTLRTRLLEVFSSDDVTYESVDNLLDDLNVTNTGLSAWFVQHTAPAYGLTVDGSQRAGRGDVEMFAIGDGNGAVFSSAYSELTLEDEQYLREWLADSEQKKICHDAKGVRHAFAGVGVNDMNGIVKDTALAAYLLHPESRSYELNDVCMKYLRVDISAIAPEGMIPGFGGAIEPFVAHAGVLLPLSRALDAALKEYGFEQSLLDLEMNVSRILTDMEAAGVAVDAHYLEQLRTLFAERVDEAARNAYAAIGREVNLSSPKQLSEVLFDELDLPKTKKTKLGYTTNAEALEGLVVAIAHREDDNAVKGQEFLASLLEHRDAIKMLQSVEGLERAVQSDGRIRTTYQQTVTATGRLSSSEPNLQNIHARTEEGLQIREAFIAAQPYTELMTADYSQIEMRLMASFSGDEALIAAFNEGADLHTYVASRVYGIAEEDVTTTQRSRIKAMSYGLVYGLSAYGLSRQLRIDVGDAQRLMDDYFSRFGTVKEYLDSLVAQARKDGYTQTIRGRRRYLPELSSTNRNVRDAGERMALNAPIQGSAADIIKIAMVNVDRALREADLRSRMLLQVHDELIFEVAPGEREVLEELVRQEMGRADEGQLRVPLEVGIGVGENWRSAAH